MGPKTLKRIGLNVLKNRGSGVGGISAVHDGKTKPVIKSTLAWRDLQYDWNIDDDHDIPGTVKIMLSGLDPQRLKNRVVFSVPDRCFIPVPATNASIELFDQNSTSIHQDENKSQSRDMKMAPRLALNQLGTSLQSPGMSVDLLDIPTPEMESRPQTAASDNMSTASDPAYDDAGSILEAEISDMKGVEDGSSSPKRKPNKGINHFSFCDRATQTSVPPTRFAAVQTEAPPRSSFSAITNAYVIFDAYEQDQQQLQAKNPLILQSMSGRGTGSGTTGPAAGTEVTTPMYLQPSNEVMLTPAAFARLNKAAHIIERMLNQNTFDEISQDFKYWEDAADEYREYDGTLMPLWRFAPPQHLLRMFQENGVIRSGVSTYVSCVCLNPHYKDLFAMGLGSRNNMSPEGGLVNVFSLKSPAMPEQSTRMSAGVSSVDFHREYWQLLAVGLHDGHIVVLDLAVKSRVDGEVVINTSINRTSILRGKRTVPITQVKWSGDTPDGNLRLLSISADGCLCSWLFIHGELYPTELITLPFKGESSPELESFHTALGTPMLTASCSAMALHGSNSMVLVGTDEGQMWPVTLDGELMDWGPILAHQGPVYTVEWNPFHPHVFLTCGADWLVKIWDDREKNPLVVLDFGCAVEDACWSPYSSTVFGCMVTKGRVSIYDLNIRLYKPLCSQRIVAQRRSKLTKMTFSPHHPIIMVGDDRGHVSCMKLSPNLRKITPVPETARPIDVEIGKLERVIRLMKKQEN